MEVLSLHNPVFRSYVVAASIMILKCVGMSWLTVMRMMREKGGFRAPEDIRRTPLNPDPNPAQLLPNDRVERIRRIQMNDLESVPFFLAAGMLYLFSQPDLRTARWLFYGYVASRLAHFLAYLGARSHDLRAALWTPGSMIVVYMTVAGLSAAL